MPLDDISNPLANVIDSEAQIEKVAGGFQFTEGPVWLPDGSLVFSDIPANTMYRWQPGMEKAEIFRHPSGHANGNTLDLTGCLLTCEHDRRVSRTTLQGETVVLAERYQGHRLNSPNDIVVRSDGSIFFTDPPYGLPNQREGKELDFNGVYCLSPSGVLSLLDDSFVRPNGLAFSPDEKTLYVDDSHEMHIRAFDVQDDGTLANGRIWAELVEPGQGGVPDGMKVDVAGNVWCTGPAGVWVLDAAGRILGRIELPELPANLAWGDEDLKTLYITARTSLYRIRTKTGGQSLIDR